MINFIDAGERAGLTPPLTVEVGSELYQAGYLSTFNLTVNIAELSTLGGRVAEEIQRDAERDRALHLLARVFMQSGSSTAHIVELNPLISALGYARREALEYLHWLHDRRFIVYEGGDVSDSHWCNNPRISLTEGGIEEGITQTARMAAQLRWFYPVFDWTNRLLGDKWLAAVVLSVIANVLTTLLFVALYALTRVDYSQIPNWFRQPPH